MIAIATAGVVGSGEIRAATPSWIGNTSASWSNLANWNTTPAGGSPIFGLAGSSGTALVDDFTGLTLTGLTFNASAPSYTVSADAGGDPLILGASTVVFTNQSTSSVQTINFPISLNGGTLTATNAATTANSFIFSGAIGDGSTPGGTFKVSSGTTTVTASNSYTGATVVNSGTLILSGLATLGSTSTSLLLTNAGVLDVGATSQTVGNPSTFAGTAGTVENNGGGLVNLTFGYNNTGGGNFTSTIENAASGGGTISLTKVGTGSIELSGALSYTGGTTVNGGTLAIGTASGGVIRTSLTIGDGTDPAAVLDLGSVSNHFNGALALTINANGTLSLGGLTETAHTVNIAGIIDTGGGTFGLANTGASLTLNGGTIENGTFSPTSAGTTINSNGNTTSLISSIVFLSGLTPTITVADGTAPIDMQISGQITGSTNIGFTKSGAGVLEISGANSNNYGPTGGTTLVSAGTLLFDNTSGAGSGQTKVSVSGGATLGGTGTIGGVSGYTLANVTVAGSSGNPANLAPGDINSSTGAHVIGDLTIGSASQANSGTFGSYSLLSIVLGASNTNDELIVHGTLTLTSAANGTTLALTSANGVTPSGNYTVAAFSTLSGTFNGLTFNGTSEPTSWIHYDTTVNDDIYVTVPAPEPTSAAALIGGGLVVLSRRHRRLLPQIQPAQC